MWAEDKNITLTYESFGLSTSYAEKTATVDGIGFTVNQGYKGTGNTIQMNSSKGSGILYNTTAITGLKSITVNVSSGNKTYTITTGTTATPTANSQTGTTGGTYNATAGDTYFQLKVSGASYFSSIVITYSDDGGGSSAETTTTTIDDSGITNTDVYVGTSAGSLTASVTDESDAAVAGATVTWSGDNDAVATINASTGAVTLVSAGSVTFTATYAGETDVYTASSDTYELTVTDSTPFEGGDVTFNATTDTGTSPLTKKVVTFTCSNGALNNGSEYRLYKNSVTTFSLSSDAISDGYKITSIAFTGVSGNPASGFGEQSGWTTDDNNGTWTGSANSVSFTASGAQVRATQIVVTVTKPAANQVVTPVITVMGPEPFLTTKTVQITCETEGATIYYTTDGTDASTSSTEYTGTFVISETTTVKAIAVKDEMTNSMQAEATFTKEEVLDGIAALTAKTDVSNTTYYVNLTNAQVTYVNGTNGFMEDATAGIYVYKVEGLTLNTVYNGIFQVTYQKYNSLPEIKTAITAQGGTTSIAGSDKAATAIELATLTSNWTANLGRKVSLSGVLPTSTTVLTSGVALRDETSTIEAGKTYNLVGYAYLNNSNQQFNVVSATEVVVAAISVAPSSIDADAAGESDVATVTYSNITSVVADVQLCDAGGNDATYDWFTASIDSDDNVEYIIEENTSTEARTAYFKVYAMDDESNLVYSNLVTVTQAGVVVDYATLPFSWAGGTSAAFNALDGITTSGLGSDYAAGNAPYLIKLDTTGDYIEIKTNEQPGVVFVDVKMIGGGSTSSITVEESEDGTSFTDVETLSISGSQNDVLNLSTVNAFASTTRYVRLTFTKGSNVGVGAINVTKPVKFNSEGYATFASTNGLNFSGAAYTAWIVTAINGDAITFSQVTEAPANTGLLLMGTAGNAATFTKKDAATLSGTNLLDAITTATPVTAGQYYGLSGNEFVPVTAGTVPAGKALLPATEVGARSLSMVFEGVDGINEIVNGKSVNGTYYDLSGRRVSKAQKGIYIVNGKKVVK